MEPVAGVAEVAVMLGVSRQRVHQLSRRADWPRGQLLASGWVWSEAEIEAWTRQRTPHWAQAVRPEPAAVPARAAPDAVPMPDAGPDTAAAADTPPTAGTASGGAGA